MFEVFEGMDSEPDSRVRTLAIGTCHKGHPAAVVLKRGAIEAGVLR